MSTRLTIVRPGLPLPDPAGHAGETVVRFDDFRRWVRDGRILAHLARHREGRLLVHRLESSGRPLPLALALRALCRGRMYVEDARGRRRTIDGAQLLRWIGQTSVEPFQIGQVLKRVDRAITQLERNGQPRPDAAVDLVGSPLYLRTDLSFGVRAGGSVGHIAGVINTLGAFTGPVILLTTDDIPTLDPEVEAHTVEPYEAFWNFRELPTFLLNEAFVARAQQVSAARPLAFVYQRYSLNSYAGLAIARQRQVPFVLEYNGSEIWMSRNWSRRLKYEHLAERIERLNLTAADLVVVVSDAMRQELVARGIDGRRVLVNPNGVDVRAYRSDLDGAVVRRRHDLGDARVVGFIGTFEAWHGAETLAEAFLKLLRDDQSRARTMRLMMIGDGPRLGAVRRLLDVPIARDVVVFTGLIGQERGPEYLAACDVLTSPHVPNPDGSPFFGSPTKLFEYMAMGKGIVASRLGQIGQVLQHERTALLVTPGDVDALAAGIGRLVDDAPLCQRLGAAARSDVTARFTWHEHTRRTIDTVRAMAAAN